MSNKGKRRRGLQFPVYNWACGAAFESLAEGRAGRGRGICTAYPRRSYLSVPSNVNADGPL